MNTPADKPEDKAVGRYLRSGLKPNFRPDFKPNDKPNRSKSIDKKRAKIRLKIQKNVLKDEKLFWPQSVQIERLKGHVIRRFDKKFYQKYSKRLKAEKALSKYSKLRQTLLKSHPKPSPAQNESPKRMLLWNSPKAQVKQQSNHPILRSHVRRLAKCDDRENSIICLPEFCRNLNLIGFNDMSRMNTKQMNTTFSIRHISKCEDYSLNENNEVEISCDYLIGSNNENQSPNSSETHIKKKKKRNVWTANKVKQKYSKLEIQRRRKAEVWQKNYLNCVSMYAFSSPMGSRVFRSIKYKSLETPKVEQLVRRYDRYCGTREQRRFRSKEDVQYNNWKLRRIERLTTGLELSVRNRSFNSHQYSFTRRQRLEKRLRTKTGIDWKSRLLALNCSPKTEITIMKLLVCPFCRQNIQFDHNCDKASDCESPSPSGDDIKQNSSVISSNNSLNTSRVLRNKSRISDEKKVSAKVSPKVSPQVSAKRVKKPLSPKKPRICLINLDKTLN